MIFSHNAYITQSPNHDMVFDNFRNVGRELYEGEDVLRVWDGTTVGKNSLSLLGHTLLTNTEVRVKVNT